MLLLAASALSGCNEEATAKPAQHQPKQTAAAHAAPETEPVVDPVLEAERLFKSRCAVCHGAQGHGDGPGAAALSPRPRNLSDAEWQASVDDAAIAKVILQGGAAVGKSQAMPPSADLKSKQATLAELVKLIRGFGEAR